MTRDWDAPRGPVQHGRRCTCEQAVRDATAPLLAEIERLDADRIDQNRALKMLGDRNKGLLAEIERLRHAISVQCSLNPTGQAAYVSLPETPEIRSVWLLDLEAGTGKRTFRGGRARLKGVEWATSVIVPSVFGTSPLPWPGADGGID